MVYRGIKIPKLNGRPLLQARGLDDFGQFPGVRIIYPNGNVEWQGFHIDHFYAKGCTSWNWQIGHQDRNRQLAAIKNAIDYSLSNDWEPKFLGYT